MADSDLLSPIEIAKHFRVSRQTVYRWMRRSPELRQRRHGTQYVWLSLLAVRMYLRDRDLRRIDAGILDLELRLKRLREEKDTVLKAFGEFFKGEP